MARIVKLIQSAPLKIEPGHERPIWVCTCGLSKTFPICDGSHKTTAKIEEPGKVYHYDPVTLAIISVKDEPV